MTSLDPRWFQVGALSTLLLASITRYDLAATPGQSAATIAAALLVQALFCAGLRVRFEPLSPLITGLSLSLLLRTHDPLLWVAAPTLAVASKFLLRVRGKHLFNPAAFAIVALLGAGADVWVSPGQWGTQMWVAAGLLCAGSLVLGRVGRLPIAGAFLATYVGLLLARALWLGDPMAIPWHQLQSGSLLVFTCFMITDPRSTPDHAVARLVFAVTTAALAFELQFGFQVRTGLYWGLAAASVLTPLCDALMPAARFRWRSPNTVLET